MLFNIVYVVVIVTSEMTLWYIQILEHNTRNENILYFCIELTKVTSASELFLLEN